MLEQGGTTGRDKMDGWLTVSISTMRQRFGGVGLPAVKVTQVHSV